MPFSIPTLSELRSQASNEVSTRLGLSKLLPESVLYKLSQVWAGLVWGLYGLLVRLAEQMIPDTATGEYLRRWAVIWGVVRNAAGTASGTVRFTGTGANPIPEDTLLSRAGDAVRYRTQADAVLVGGQADVAVLAVDAGAAGNAEPGVSLNLTTPIPGVDTAAIVQADAEGKGLSGGAEVESDPDYRERFLLRVQKPPQGGAEADYLQWMGEVPGVTRSWVLDVFDAPNVWTTFLVDGEPDPIPGAGKVQEVQDYLSDDSRRPVTSNPIVSQPSELLVPMTIQLSPNTAEVQASVQEALENFFQREAVPGGVTGSTIFLSQISEAISTAPGEESHVLVQPATDVVPDRLEIPFLGTITWQ